MTGQKSGPTALQQIDTVLVGEWPRRVSTTSNTNFVNVGDGYGTCDAREATTCAVSVVDVVVWVVITQCRTLNRMRGNVPAFARRGFSAIIDNVRRIERLILVAERQNIIGKRYLKDAVPIGAKLEDGCASLRMDEDGRVNRVGDSKGVLVGVWSLTRMYERAIINPCVRSIRINAGGNTNSRLAGGGNRGGVKDIEGVVPLNDGRGPRGIPMFVGLVDFTTIREDFAETGPGPIHGIALRFVVGNSGTYVSSTKDIIVAVGVDGSRIVDEEIIGSKRTC